ncbi:MAG: rhomboid family intramembrane serine protease [Myxococcales bacterium]|nr:rhomboid family intramembrane serine protease [Myxococcales bacterium]MCB9706327.1 rhomboid family intramembrane serine protease [Myxococcales bacterium]
MDAGDLSLPFLVLAAFAVGRLMLSLRGIPWALSGSWWIASATIIAGAGLTYALAPDLAGLVAFALVALLMVAPGQAISAAQDALRRGAERRAIALIRLAALLHPSASYRERPRFFRLITDLRAGEIPKAELEHFATHDPELGKILPALVDHLQGDIGGVLRRLADPETRPQLLASGLGLAYLRAVGVVSEDGDTIAAAFHEFAATDPSLRQADVIALVAVFLPALAGDVATTRRHAALLHAYLGPAEPATAEALALARSGDRPAALALLDAAAARHRGDRMAAHHVAAYRRVISEACVDHPPTPSAALDGIIQRLAREAPALAEVAALEGRGAERLPLTWSIIVVLALVHLVVSLTGDPLDPRHLYEWGALGTGLFTTSEAWRLFTSTLLHGGLLHLALNLIALRFFGRFVEPLFGRPAMAVIYVASGVLAALAVARLADPEVMQILVGASGSIMGLGGATLAAALRRPALRRSRRGRAQIRGLVVLFALQMVFDFLAETVSSTAHIAGLLIGFLLGLILAPPADQAHASARVR